MKQILFIGVVFLLLVNIASAQYSADFSAEYFLSRPGLIGYLTGKISYSQTFQSIRYDTDPIGSYYEIYHYDVTNVNELFVYRACTGQCDIIPQPQTIKMPIFNYVAGDTCAATASTTAKYGSCFLCTPKAGTVKSYCLNDLTNRVPIQVSLNDGTVLELQKHAPGGAAALAATYVPVPAWGCVLNCGAVADITLIIDESGSISGNYIPGVQNDGEWSKLREFVIKLVEGFSISPDKVNMGLVFFSTGSRVQLPVISDQVAFRNAVNGLTRQGTGTTWIGAGIVNGANTLKNAPRPTVPKIAILLTDGVSNCPNPFDFAGRTWQNAYPTNLEWLTYMRSIGQVVTIGVGTDSEINTAYLTDIASVSASSGNKMFFRATSFNDLVTGTLIKDITTSVCTASSAPSTPCPACAGLCTCGTCVCPSSCDDSNPCTIDTCTPTKNNRFGCLYEDKKCDDGNACTVDSCDPKLPGGCTTKVKDCNDNDVCTIDTCDNAVGCLYAQKNCDDGNACTVDTCDKVTGCKHTPVVCDDGIPCTLDSCDTKVGCLTKQKDKDFCFDKTRPCFTRDCDTTTGLCKDVQDLCKNLNPCTYNNGPGVFLPIDCTQGSKCIKSDCNPLSTNPTNGCLNTTVNCDDGSACTVDTCDAATGCNNAVKNCDDNDKCTTETCDKVKGCVYTKTDCDDKNECTVDTCDKVKGCIHTPKVCADDDACTDDTCDSKKAGGCVFTPIDITKKCNDGSECTTDTCDKVKGCQNTPLNCTKILGDAAAATTLAPADNSTKIADPCITNYKCDVVRGCLSEQQCNTTVETHPPCSFDSCGGDEAKCQKVDNKVDACAIAAVTVGTALGVAAIAGIIIAAVLVTGAGAGAAIYGYNQVYKGEFENKNPLYEADTKVGQNQLYTGNAPK
jgi:hypothetical protein